MRPTIVDPWRQRIAACRSVADVEAAQHDLLNYVVLDPACGSGNFLYVAYREPRRIEGELRRRATDMRRNAGLRAQESLPIYFPLSNVRGIEIDPFAVQLARVTLWMGHKLAVEELGINETVLPLADLSGIQRGDALAIDWPRADAIIGNPPYHGDRMLGESSATSTSNGSSESSAWGSKTSASTGFVRRRIICSRIVVPGSWEPTRVSQNRARSASLDYIVQTGGVITDAISSKDWSGDAAVDVSIVNWIKARIFFAWQGTRTCPSNATDVFAFEDDYSLGVLSSTIHHEWARAQSSTLEDRFRYTPTSAFETFPWPSPDPNRRNQIADAARRLPERRSEICLERQIGLTRLYNEVDEGAYRDLYELHRELDEAVAAAYGWPASAAHDPAESNRLLLNRAIAAGEVDYRPFDRG